MDEKRLAWADLLRVLAIAGVLLIHSAAPLLVRYSSADATAWWIGNAYDSAVRWCVPLFLMLSGALLLGRPQPLGRFLSSRLRRVAVPFVAWSAIYLLWARHFHGQRIEPGDLPRLLLEGPAYYHLWFFYVILALYLLVPLLSALLRRVGRRGAWALVGAWMLVVSVLPLVGDLAGWREAPESVELSPLAYLGYFVLGFLLRDLPSRGRHVGLLSALFAAAWALTAAGTWLLTVRLGGGLFDGLFYEYCSVNVLLMSVAVFLLGKSVRLPALLHRSRGRIGRALRSLSASSLGVYLVHALVIDLLKSGRLGMRFDQTSLHPLLGVPLFAATVFALSLALVAALRRVPLLGRVVP